MNPLQHLADELRAALPAFQALLGICDGSSPYRPQHKALDRNDARLTADLLTQDVKALADQVRLALRSGALGRLPRDFA